MAENVISPDMRLNTTGKQILQLAIPISAAILVPQVNFITNNIFLGMLGQEELGMAGITGVYYLVFGAIGSAIGFYVWTQRMANTKTPERGTVIYRNTPVVS